MQARSQADIQRRIRVFMVLRAGVLDSHKHLHAPKGRFGGRFISKALQGVLGREQPDSGHTPPMPSAPRRRGAASPGGVRAALAGAKSTRAVSEVATAEAKRLTGREIPFDFGGSDPAVAREHAEGVLRGLEQFPRARLHSVGVADLSHATDEGGRTVDWGRTKQLDDGSLHIDFDVTSSSPAGAATYRSALAEAGKRRRMGRGLAAADPMGIGIHEFGHVVAGPGPLGVNGKARRLAERLAEDHELYKPSGDPANAKAFHDLVIASEVSVYATESRPELTAEAFADVVAHGEEASVVSRFIMDLIEDEMGDLRG